MPSNATTTSPFRNPARHDSVLPVLTHVGGAQRQAVAEWGHRGLLVKFKLEVGVARDELIRIGQASRRSSGADYLIANTLDMVEGPAAGAFLLGEHGEEWVPRDELPARLVQLVRRSGEV